jgi:methionyl-tRNA formyltransferase
LILPPTVLALPRRGCLNIHASLLPRWRGAAPIQRAILAGDAETGVCIMQMEAGLDTGPVLLSRALPITPEDTGGSLHERLAVLGATLIVEALGRLAVGPLEARPQPAEGVTYAAKLSKSEADIDWSQSAKSIALKVRAFNPFPVARTHLDGVVLRIWAATAEEGNDAPAGKILRADGRGVLVACGAGALNIAELQAAGGKRMNAAAFVAGQPGLLGKVLG